MTLPTGSDPARLPHEQLGHAARTCSPQLLRESHSTRNGFLSPTDVLPRSNTPVWWRCPDGHEWATAPITRLDGRGCPDCAARTRPRAPACRRRGFLIPAPGVRPRRPRPARTVRRRPVRSTAPPGQPAHKPWRIGARRA